LKKLAVTIATLGAIVATVPCAAASQASVSHTAAQVKTHKPNVAAVTCSTKLPLPNVGDSGDGWAGTSSPYTLQLKANNPTYFCVQGSFPANGQFVQYGTSRCLTIDTANRTVTEGNCASAAADFHDINVGYGTTELQSDDNLACLEGQGLGANVTFNPCNSSNQEMVWQIGG
jgi:hypothetical protein